MSLKAFWLVMSSVMRGTGMDDSVQEKRGGDGRREEGRRRGDISTGSTEGFSTQHSFREETGVSENSSPFRGKTTMPQAQQ